MIKLDWYHEHMPERYQWARSLFLTAVCFLSLISLVSNWRSLPAPPLPREAQSINCAIVHISSGAATSFICKQTTWSQPPTGSHRRALTRSRGGYLLEQPISTLQFSYILAGMLNILGYLRRTNNLSCRKIDNTIRQFFPSLWIFSRSRHQLSHVRESSPRPRRPWHHDETAFLQS